METARGARSLSARRSRTAPAARHPLPFSADLRSHAMLDFFGLLFDTTGFPARWHCGTGWTAGLGWLHIAADVAIFGAYLAIPCVLLFFVNRRRDVPFHGLFYLFGVFILSCGMTHLVDAAIFTWPAYRFLGLMKVVTATASWLTVAALIPIVPRALELPGVMRLNEQLTREVAERTKAQAQLQEHARALEAANHRLAELTSEADAANRAKSAFLANMSHEIRTPMTAILGYSDELIRDARPGDDPARLDALRTIRENGEHLLTLVNDILDLSRIEAGRLEVERRPIELTRLVAEVESLMGVLARRKGLALHIGFDGPVPVGIHTDPLRLKQVLVNLVGNGLKYTDRGAVRLTTRLRPKGDGPDRLEFEVADTGVGMTAEEIKRLFTPYGRLGRDDDPRGSTGLGLTISQRLVELLGGRIEVRSTPGEGTTFIVTVDPGPLEGVPLFEPSCLASSAEAIRRELQAPEPPEIPEGTRVLLAEDTVSNQRLIRRMLSDAGVALDVVNDGVEAVEAVEQAEERGRSYHLVLMDMLMPNLGGLEAAARLRSLGFRFPIVALTANAMEGDRERYLRSGCDGYLAKPIDRAELLAMVARFCRHESGRGEGRRGALLPDSDGA
ncbi:ATP-binding protein [Tautonia sociabilis]|uniref:histidine kinase n=1 Tax=Tautonia sociabilis TaxID=2080755 RepID=A0A432MC70_9BACT|nr:ATP-binding protein [Tautonia sociabilis]RUL81577.1 response regulator [Tautonia sociabilis]